MRALNIVSLAASATVLVAAFTFGADVAAANPHHDNNNNINTGGEGAFALDARPELDTCSADGGCPLSAMAYATGSFTNEFLLSEAALQSASNMTLHIHLCCGYTLRGELLANKTTYARFLVELLHVSPLGHLSVREQLRLFPQELATLTRQLPDSSSDAEAGATITRRFTAKDAAKAKGSASFDAFDGDILTLVVAPQGPDFRLMPPAKVARYGSHRAGRPIGAEQYGIDYDLTYSDPSRLLGGGGIGSAGAEDADAIATEFQMFIPNFAINCKCPHTLPVLPLLKFRRDTLPPLALEGLGARCITNDAHAEAKGPWARVMYAVAPHPPPSSSAFARRQQQQRGIAATQEPPMTKAELDGLVVRPDTIVASTFFSVAPAQLPPFTRLRWRLYEVSKALAAKLQTAALSSARGNGKQSTVGGGAQSHTGAEPALYQQPSPVDSGDEQMEMDGGLLSGTFRATMAQQNEVLRDPSEAASALLAAAERETLHSSDFSSSLLRLVARSAVTTNITHDRSDSDRFDVRPNVKYLVTVDVRRGEARQVLRGLFVLRLPAWLAHPSRFLAIAADGGSASAPQLRPITVAHDHMLLGSQMQLSFGRTLLEDEEGFSSSSAVGSILTTKAYRRAWAPMEYASSQRIRNEACLAAYKQIVRAREEEKRRRGGLLGLSASGRVGADNDNADATMKKSVENSVTLPDGHYSDFFELFASAEARAKLERSGRARLEAELRREADRRHAAAIADADCGDVFALLEEQSRRGQPLRVTDDAFARGKAASGNSDDNGFGAIRSEILPQQLRHLRDPSAALFAYDEAAYSSSAKNTVLVDHLPDGSWHTFAAGASMVSVWLVDADGACNATRVEVATVHAVAPIVRRPTAAESTVCTRVAKLEASGVAGVVAAMKATFAPLNASGFEAKGEWACYEQSRAAKSGAATDDASLKAAGASLALPVTVDPPTIGADGSKIDVVSATVALPPQSTARCFFTIKASNVPRSDGNEPWLHIDAYGNSANNGVAITRGATYFSPTQDVALEAALTVHCRAFDLPMRVFVDVDTKTAQFTVTGLPTATEADVASNSASPSSAASLSSASSAVVPPLVTGRWEIRDGAPIRYVGAEGSDTHLFELLDTDIFDIAADEAARGVPFADRTYALRQNKSASTSSSSSYAYIVLDAATLKFKARYDPTGTCPEGEVAVVLRLLQTPPAAPPLPLAEERFAEDTAVVLERPRAAGPDEVVEWRVISTADTSAFAASPEAVAAFKGFFGSDVSAASRAEADAACAKNVRITLYDTEEAALAGSALVGGGLLIDAYSPRRAANSKRFARVTGLPEGTSCAVQWRAANAAGAVAKPFVIHRCRSPPTVNLYTEAPRLRAVSTFDRRQVYDDTHKLHAALAVAGVPLFPVAGQSVTLHYRLASPQSAASGAEEPQQEVLDFAHAPIADDHTLTDAGRMRILITYDSATRFPYVYNVTAVAGVRPFDAHSTVREAALQLRSNSNNVNNEVQLAFAKKGRQAPSDAEGSFGSAAIIDLSCPATVIQNDDKAVCSAHFTDLGNATRQLFVATVEVEPSEAALVGSSDAAAARLASQSLRVRREFQQRGLCHTSHRPFALFSLAPEAVLGLQEHPATREENKGSTGRGGSTLAVRFCTDTYHFFVRRELFTTLGYDFGFECASGSGFSVERVSETELVVKPAVVGATTGLCTFTVTNRVTNTKDSVAVEFSSVRSSASSERFSLYLLPDVAADLAAGLTAEQLSAKHPNSGASILLQAANTSAAAEAAAANGRAGNNAAAAPQSAAERRRQRYKALSTKPKEYTPTAQQSAAAGLLAKSAIVAVGRTVDLVAYSRAVAPYSGQWSVLNMVPARDVAIGGASAEALRAADVVTSGGHLAATRIRETAADGAGCAESCIGGALSHIPVSGFYTVGYAFPDTANPDVCPATTVARTVFVFLAEALTPEIVTCVPNVTIRAAPLPHAHRAQHYGKWSIVTHHTSPTDVAPYPEEYISFDNPFMDSTTVRGLRFGVVRLRWNIYRNGTDELLDSAIVVIKVLTDSLPSDRVVAFKDSAVVPATSSTINWRAMRPNIRVSFRRAAADSSHQRYGVVGDHTISGELHVSNLPLGLTRLRYDAVRSARAAQFPMLAHLECPKRSQGDFWVERVAASLTAGTTMRVECHAYSGQGVVTIRLATGGSDGIKLVAADRLKALVYNGTAKLELERPQCRAPWWAREGASRWTNVTYFDNDRAVNITLRATEYLSQEELESVPFFATGGRHCPESGAFISSSVIEGVPHDGAASMYVPIVDPVSARLHSNFYLRPIEGHRSARTAGESALSAGNASVDIALTRGASFGFHSNETLLRACLRGEVPLSAIAAPWTLSGTSAAAAPPSHRAQQAWARYAAAAGSLSVRCEPMVFLPRGGSTTSTMTIGQLEEQLQVIHRDTVQTLRNRDGVDVYGLSRSTQVALAARRVTAAQLAEILHRNRRMEAERLARAQSVESDADRFDRVMRLSASVFGDDAVVSAIRVTLPAFPPFFATEDILLNVRVSKATVCSIAKDDPEAPTNASGHGQSLFGQLLIEDEPVAEAVTPNAFSQCEFESSAPVFNLHLRNGAFRPDASLSTCRVELIDDGIVNASATDLTNMHEPSPYESLNSGRGPISSLSGGALGSATSASVGLHACFADFLRGATFHSDPLSQKQIALRLSNCPTLKMLDLDEYNSYEPLRRTAFFRRMTQPHHMRVVLHGCVVPDKHTPAHKKRGYGPNAYVDGVFNVVVQPTMAHLRVLSAKAAPAAQQQLVGAETAELDRLLLCESDVQEKGALLGIELSGDVWHSGVGSSSSCASSSYGSRSVAMLNAFSVVEKEEYLMMQRTGESHYDRRQRIARLVDSRYDTSDETFGSGPFASSYSRGGKGSGIFDDLAHASSGAHTTHAVKVSKFMHYMYKQFWAQHNSNGGNGRSLVTRYNDTFVTIQIPEDTSSSGARSTMQAYQRYTGGYGGGSDQQQQQQQIVLDSSAWGFGGAIEEVRIAIPGVTTRCNACLLTDVNFFFVGDFAGSVSVYSQRALSNRMMAERAQLEAPIRLALGQLEDDRPIVLHHHWLCPTTAAKRLQGLIDATRGSQQQQQHEYSHPNEAKMMQQRQRNAAAMNGPTVELVVTIDLGKDSPSIADLQSDAASLVVGSPSADANTFASYPSPSALMRTSVVFRNATLPSGEPSSELEATLIMRSAQASALPSRILHELEVSLQFLPETLIVGHRALAAAMRRRKARLGYGRAPEDLAFSGVVTLLTCVNGAANCAETASRGIVVGPWEAEAAPIVDPQLGATMDRSYVAESQRHMNRVVHTVRSGFVAFLLFALHHLITAYVVLRVRKGPAARIAGVKGLSDASFGAAGGRGPSPDPNSDSFNIAGSQSQQQQMGYAAARSRSVSLADLDSPTAGNTAVFLGALVATALLSHFAFVVWAACWVAMWILIIVAQRAKNAATFGAFLLHFLVFLAAVRR